MNLGMIIALGSIVLAAQVFVIVLLYGFGKDQQRNRPTPPEGHT